MKNQVQSSVLANESSYPKFSLGEILTEEQKDFFDENGFLHFKSFFDAEKISTFISELERIEKEWIQEGKESINGVPIIYGKNAEGKKIVHRFAFANQCSSVLSSMLKDERIKLFFDLIKVPFKGRIGNKEKDGLVVNRYLNNKASNWTQMGWHTDGLRDIFYGRKINPMLNVGIHLDDSTEHNGGLKVLPGTHNKGLRTLLFRKAYFLNTKPDKDEVAVEVKAGDLTIHEGNVWHRVALSSALGAKSQRRVMYFPIITGKVCQKTEDSKPRLYHHLLRRFNRK